MGRSSTWVAKAGAMAAGPKKLSDTLARLMICVNDISIAADASDAWHFGDDRRRAFRKIGARTYHVRVLLSHAYEALAIVQKIARDPELKASVDACDRKVRDAFAELESFIGSPLYETLEVIRNRASFHYDAKLPGDHLRDIGRLYPDREWSYSVGSEPLDWHFELADAVIDRLVVRNAFGVRMPDGPERREGIDRIATELHRISLRFVDFAAFFVRSQLR